LRKKSKKSKPLPKSPARSGIFAEVRHLGFVVDTGMSGPKALTHALVNLRQDQDTWHVVRLGAQQSQSHIQDSVDRYFRTAFCVAVMAWLHYNKKGRLGKNATIIAADEGRAVDIGSDLRNWARLDKVKIAFEDFPRLRMAIHGSLFAASGTRKPLRVIWKGGTTPDAIFLWPPQELQRVFSDLQPDSPSQKITIRNLAPVTQLAPECLATLATAVVHSQHLNTWQDLYRTALKNSLSTDIFIDLSVSQRTPTKELDGHWQDQPSQAGSFTPTMKPEVLDVLTVLESRSRVFLTGASGSGKTTTLRHMSWLLASGERKIQGRDVLPIIVPMKWFGIWPQKKQRPPTIPGYIAFWIAKTIGDYVDTADLHKCDLFAGTRTGQRAPNTREDMLSMINQHVEALLSDGSVDLSHFVFLFDAYNEIPAAEKCNADQQLTVFLQQINAYVISSRHHAHDMAMPGVSLYEIQELNNEQILEYLRRTFVGIGEKVFSSQFEKDPHILSLARNPFYLVLIAHQIKKNPPVRIPANRAELIQNFITDSIERKHRESVYAQDGLKDDLIYTVLPHIAKWSIDNATRTKDEFLPFTKWPQFKQLQGSHNELFSLLEKAESYGILKFSGLSQDSMEHFGYPEFAHDNIRDFFAAIYLSLIDSAELPKEIPSFLEYFAWDEPLLQFLELNHSARLTRQIIDVVIPADIVLAALCIRHARIVDEDACVELERTIRESEDLKRARRQVLRDVCAHYTRHTQGNLSADILSRLPNDYLLGLLNRAPHNGPSRVDVWFAIATHVTIEDLTWLTDRWRASPKTLFLDRFFLLHVTTHIAAPEAFDILVSMYKELSQYQGDQLSPEILRLIKGPTMLFSVSCSPSLAEVISAFPGENSPGELSALLPNVREVSGNELPTLEQLVYSHDTAVAYESCKLLYKTIGKDALPVLLDRLAMLRTSRLYTVFDAYYSLMYYTILDMIVDIAPERAFEILTSSFMLGLGSSYHIALLNLLAKIYTKQTLRFFVGRLNNGRCSWPSYFCADQLERWPEREDVLSEFEFPLRQYGDSVDDGSILCAAWLGIDNFVPQASTLFDRIYSTTAARGISDPPAMYVILEDDLYITPESRRQRSEHHNIEQNLMLLPMAIRAIRKGGAQIERKLLRIIQWAIRSIPAQEFGIAIEVCFASVIQAILKLVKLSNLNHFSRSIDVLIRPRLFTDIITLYEKARWADGLISSGASHYYNERLRFAVLILCDAIPESRLPDIFSLAQALYVNLVIRSHGSNQECADILFDLITSLSRRADPMLVSDLLLFLHSTVVSSQDEKTAEISAGLMEQIKFAAGRRFLTPHGVAGNQSTS